VNERPATDEELCRQRRAADPGPAFGRWVVVLGGAGGLILTAVGLKTAALGPGLRLGGLPCLLLGVTCLWTGGWTLYHRRAGRTGQDQQGDRPPAGTTLAFALRRERLPLGCVLWPGVTAAALLSGGVALLAGLLLGNPPWWGPGNPLETGAGQPDVPGTWVLAVVLLLSGLALAAAAVLVLVTGFPIWAGVRATRVQVSDYPLRLGGAYEVYVCQPGPLRAKALGVRLVREATVTYVRTADDGEVSGEVRSETLADQELLAVEGLSIPLGWPYEVCVPFVVPATETPCRFPTRWKIVVQLTFARRAIDAFVFPVEVIAGLATSAADVALAEKGQEGEYRITSQRRAP
jgi:hypothetical protein